MTRSRGRCCRQFCGLLLVYLFLFELLFNLLKNFRHCPPQLTEDGHQQRNIQQRTKIRCDQQSISGDQDNAGYGGKGQISRRVDKMGPNEQDDGHVQREQEPGIDRDGGLLIRIDKTVGVVEVEIR